MFLFPIFPCYPLMLNDPSNLVLSFVDFTFFFTILQVGSLVIHSVNKRDSGNYSCSPSNSPPLQITLNVINGMYRCYHRETI